MSVDQLSGSFVELKDFHTFLAKDLQTFGITFFYLLRCDLNRPESRQIHCQYLQDSLNRVHSAIYNVIHFVA